jgi:prepilin-type N-terminal cleavage/methylation domain-containing protein
MKRQLHEKTAGAASAVRRGKEGVTLIEFVGAVAIISIMAAAIYVGGTSVLRHAQAVTITAAAQIYAKEKLEELISTGYDTLTGGDPSEEVILMNPNTHKVNLTRMVDVVWHDSDGTVLEDPVDEGYAEIIVEVSWKMPLNSSTASTTISTLLF